MTDAQPSAGAREQAQRAWAYRLSSELEASERFRSLAPLLRAQGTSALVVDLAEASAADELRHATLCRKLVAHFGGAATSEQVAPPSRLAPPALEGRQHVLYEVVALSCVTETLSTALLAELVINARDAVCRSAMHEILRDEVKHSRLGWAHLAEEQGRGIEDCVGQYLPQMLRDTLGADFFDVAALSEPLESELARLGFLQRAERQRVVRETLVHVIFPGFERFGVDTVAGRRWLASMTSEPVGIEPA